MNKNILTRVISFVLVLCLLVPLMPNLGISFVSSAADVKEGTETYTYLGILLAADTFFLKTNSNKALASTSSLDPYVVTLQYSVISTEEMYYIPLSNITAVLADAGSMSFSATQSILVDGSVCGGVSGIKYVPVVPGADPVCVGKIDSYSGRAFVSASNMGLIIFDGGSENRGKSLWNVSDLTYASQVAIMKNFLFDHLGVGFKSGAYDATSGTLSNVKFTAVDAFSVSKMTTTEHPYLLTNQAEFDALHSFYNGGDNENYDAALFTYLDSIVKDAASLYNAYAADSNGTLKDAAGLKSAGALEDSQTDLNDMPYYTKDKDKANGYDSGGRQAASSTLASRILTLAYAYQITREQKYATLALNMAVALSSWEHWGAGHFLNAADAAYAMALAFDWCYNVWGTIDSTARNTVRDGLFVKGVFAGAISSYLDNTNEKANRACPWYNNVVSGGFLYKTRSNNWNGVCTSGMILAALALMPETGSVANIQFTALKADGSAVTTTSTYGSTKLTVGNYYPSRISQSGTGMSRSITSLIGTTYQAISTWLINDNIRYLEMYGLEQYTPDGSYIESASYWSYGTNAIMRTIAALESSCGTDFGLSSAWGLDQTAYFSYYAQSSDGDAWKYHDSNSDTIDTSMNALYGTIIGDDNIVSYRKYLIAKGAAEPSFYDTFGYSAAITDQYKEMSTDRYMPGIEGYSVRDTWESGGIYAAFMGGPNKANHVQLDSGAFVYYNNGVKWFQDIGCEDYGVISIDDQGNTHGYTYGKDQYSWTYYPSSPEGNNTIATDAYQYGQNPDAYAAIEKYDSNDYGAYAVLDQKAVFSDVATSAKRGMLITNDRKTVVIQDEITFKSNLKKYGTSSEHTAYWFAHVTDAINITIADNGQTAYLTDGKTTIRCSIVAGNSDTAGKASFTVKDCAYGSSDESGTYKTNMVLPGTDPNGNVGGSAQKQYDNWQKLTVACTGITNLQLAIVIEEVVPGSNAEVNYEWTSLASWNSTTPTSDDRSYDDKILLYKNFEDTGIGSFSSFSGNLQIANTLYQGDNAMGAFFFSDRSSSSSITLTAAPARVENGSIGNSKLITEFDLATLDEIPDTLTIALYGTDIYPTFELTKADLGDYISQNFTRITVILDEATDIMYLFVGDKLVSATPFRSRSYEGLRLVISTKDGKLTKGTILIDNVVIRVFTERYTELDSIVMNGSGLSEWKDVIFEVKSEESVDVIGKIYNVGAQAPEVDDDTPLIDLWDTGSASETQTQAGVNTPDRELGSFAELEEAIATGKYTHVDLYCGNNSPIEIKNFITVNTNGYSFYAVSDNLICQVDGNVYTYKTGIVTATFIYNGVAYYVDYTGAQLASCDMSGSSSGVTIREVYDAYTNQYTYYSLANNAWSSVAGGARVYGRDLVVTTKNNVFYAVEDLYTGYYVTVKDGVISPGGTPESFFKTALSGSYDRICITNDFYYMSSQSNVLGADQNIYLNGHTISYDAKDASMHIFQSTYHNLNVYGPGMINNLAENSNVIMMGYNSGVKERFSAFFRDVTFETYHPLVDMRSGTVEFNNCVINTNTNEPVINLDNYSGGKTNVTVNEAHIPLLIVDGCVFNAQTLSNNPIISVSDNSRAIIKGATRFNSLGASMVISVEKTPDDGKAPDADSSANAIYPGEEIMYMYIHLGEIYHDNAVLVSCADPKNKAVGAHEIYNVISYVDGAAFGSYVYGDSRYDSEDAYLDALNENGINYKIADGYVLARTGSSGFEWKIISEEEAVTVTWKHGSVEASEYWIPGVTPRMLDGVKEYVDKLSKEAGTGFKYTCDMSSLNGGTLVAGKTYVFNTMKITNLSIRMSMSLHSDFVLKFFFEVRDGVNYEYFMIDGVRYEVADCYLTNIEDSNGNVKPYRCVTVNVAPKRAADNITVYAKLSDGTAITASTSIVNYAEKLMASSAQTIETKKLMYAIVEYVAACCQYETNYFDSSSMDTLLSKYAAYKSSEQLYAKDVDTGKVNSAIKSVYMDIGKVPAFAFRFRETFTGTVTFSYKTLDKEGTITYTVNVVNGIVEETGSSVYIPDIKAYDMDKDITITIVGIAGAQVDYSISAYYTQAVQAADELYELLCALNAYCKAADVYKSSLAS